MFGVVVMVVGVVRIYQTHIVSLNLPSYPKRKIIPFPSFSAELMASRVLSHLPKVTGGK